MIVRLELKPDVEATLSAQARARGVTLDSYLQSFVEDLARTQSVCPARLQEIGAALDALAAMGQDLPPLPAGALNRESIYQDHN